MTYLSGSFEAGISAWRLMRSISAPPSSGAYLSRLAVIRVCAFAGFLLGEHIAHNLRGSAQGFRALIGDAQHLYRA